ncbi:MAG: hypothetical protein BMS9Abin28_2169 [Anaerolineae bacterium]|nr:MAG: hypothetical protein BMS9Abin28_2169 [Anaerolineae bacterium]
MAKPIVGTDSELTRASSASVAGRIGTRLAELAADRTHVAALLAFLISMFLVSAGFFPNLAQINAWDEAVWVNSGRVLLEGQLPSYGGNPLVALFYALTYLPYMESPLWLIHSTSLGRVLLFGMVWIGAYSVAWQLRRLAHPLLIVGLLFVSGISVSLLVFPSDPLFVSFAALSLAQVLAYINSGRLGHIWLSAVLIAMAALARNDGLILGVLLIPAAFIIARPRGNRWKAALGAAVPLAAIVGGYILLYGAITGNLELGTLERTYENFEAGHQAIYAGEGELNAVIEAKREARRIFGTPEENNYSVFRAIGRNPQVYLQRVSVVIRGLPDQLVDAYGKRLAVPLFLFAVRGIWSLITQKHYRRLFIFGVWAVPLASGLVITLFRLGHLRFYFYALFALTAIGISTALKNIESRREQAFWLIALLAFALYGVFDSKLAFTYGAVAVLAALALGLLWVGESKGRAFSIGVPALLLFSAGLLLHGDYPGPKIRKLGEAADEAAVLFLQETYDRGTPIAAGSPGPIYTARMTYMGLTALDVPQTETPRQFLEWMNSQGIEAVYVDQSLSFASPYLWEQISALIGDGLERVYIADEGDIQVLSLTRP